MRIRPWHCAVTNFIWIGVASYLVVTPMHVTLFVDRIACVHADGLHATLAGLLLALFIPTRPPTNVNAMMTQADVILKTETAALFSAASRTRDKEEQPRLSRVVCAALASGQGAPLGSFASKTEARTFYEEAKHEQRDGRLFRDWYQQNTAELI